VAVNKTPAQSHQVNPTQQQQ